MFKAAVTLLFVCFCSWGFASLQDKLDSLTQRFSQFSPQEREEKEGKNTILLLGRHWAHFNIDSSLHYQRLYYSIAVKQGNLKGQVNSYRRMAYVYKMAGDIDNAMFAYQDAWSLIREEEDLDLAIPLLSDLAGTYYNAGFFEASKKYMLAQLTLINNINNSDHEKGALLSNLGFNCMELASKDSSFLDSAQYYFNLALLEAQNRNDTFVVGVTYDYLGELAVNRSDFQTAESNFRRALALMTEQMALHPKDRNNRVFKGRAYYKLAVSFSIQAKPDSVLKYAELAKGVWALLEYDRQKPKLANLSLVVGKALAQKGNFKAAKEQMELGIRQADSIPNDPSLLSEAYFQNAQFYARQKLFEPAFHTLGKHLEIEKALALETDKWGFLSNHSALLNTIFKLQLQKEKEETHQAKRIRNLSIGTSVAISLLFVVVLVLMYNLRASNRLNQENAQQLLFLNQTKDRLMSVLGHDLRAPFQSILVMSNQSQTQIEQKNWSRVKTAFRVIGNSAQEAYHLFENLLGWAKSQSGELPFQPEALDLSSLVDETKLILMGMAETKQVSFVTELDFKFVHGDRFMVSAILRNLMTNAVKFSPSGKSVHLKANLENNWVVLHIRNAGAGLDSKALESLRSGKNVKTGGHGLGLVLCREFTERHGGKFTVESKPGEWTAFTIQLPVGDASQVRNIAATAAVSPLSSSPTAGFSLKWIQEYPDMFYRLKQLKVYHSSQAKKMLGEIDTEKYPAFEAWLYKLCTAMDEFNEFEFSRLMRELPSQDPANA